MRFHCANHLMVLRMRTLEGTLVPAVENILFRLQLQLVPVYVFLLQQLIIYGRAICGNGCFLGGALFYHECTGHPITALCAHVCTGQPITALCAHVKSANQSQRSVLTCVPASQSRRSVLTCVPTSQSRPSVLMTGIVKKLRTHLRRGAALGRQRAEGGRHKIDVGHEGGF